MWVVIQTDPKKLNDGFVIVIDFVCSVLLVVKNAWDKSNLHENFKTKISRYYGNKILLEFGQTYMWVS